MQAVRSMWVVDPHGPSVSCCRCCVGCPASLAADDGSKGLPSDTCARGDGERGRSRTKGLCNSGAL